MEVGVDPVIVMLEGTVTPHPVTIAVYVPGLETNCVVEEPDSGDCQLIPEGLLVTISSITPGSPGQMWVEGKAVIPGAV